MSELQDIPEGAMFHHKKSNLFYKILNGQVLVKNHYTGWGCSVSNIKNLNRCLLRSTLTITCPSIPKDLDEVDENNNYIKYLNGRKLIWDKTKEEWRLYL